MNIRELVATTLENDVGLDQLGITAGVVFQAETVDSPTDGSVFLTIRFGEEFKGVGPVNRKDCQIWVYGPPGNYDVLGQIAKRAREVLVALEQVQLDNGWLMKFEDLGMGGDFFDDGFNSLVVPYRLRAVGSGF